MVNLETYLNDGFFIIMQLIMRSTYNKYKIHLLTAILLNILMSNVGFSQSVFTNPISGTNPNTSNPYTTGQTVDANITVSGIGRGAGINGTNANNRYNANSWNVASLADAITNNKYFEFTLSPNAGFEINFTSFVYTGQASGTGPTSVAFRASTDGFSSNIGAPSITGTTINLNVATFQNISGPITFRLYAWGASAAGGTFSVNNFTFNGTVESGDDITSTVLGSPFNQPNCFTAVSGSVNYTATGSFNAGNNFVVQLSNASGEFTSPVDIGALSSSNSTGNIPFQIPAATVPSANYRIRIVSSDPIVTGSASAAFAINLAGGPCESVSTDFFRSRTSGIWHDTESWESSSDNVNWIPATLTPTSAANTISIRANHTITITENLTVDQVVVNQDGFLSYELGTLVIANGAGNDIEIENGGVFEHNSDVLPTLNGTIRVQSFGILRVSNNPSGSSGFYAGIDSENKVIYQNRAIFEWNVNTPFLSANQTYFPNVNALTKPIFRTLLNIGVSIGAGSTTTINGIFEPNGNINFANNGDKVFRNGIIGSGNVTQTASSGRFFFSGDTAFLGGVGSINLIGDRLNANNDVWVEMTSNKTINDDQFRLTNGSTLNCNEFELSGTGNIRLNSNVTLITQHPNGVDGALGGLSGINFVSDREQTVIFERNGPQNAGTIHLPDELGRVIVRNGSSLLLQKNLSIENLSGGSFEVVGPNSELRAQAPRIDLNINGNRFFTLSNGGSMDDSCLENLRFETGGNSSTATFSGNGETIKCWNFTSEKTGSGGVILNENSTLYCANNLQVDYSPGSAVFVDNGNDIFIGDDLRLKGLASNFNFTGTITMTCENSGTGQADIEVENANNTDAIQAELNNFVVNSSNTNANIRFQGLTGNNTITIKGDFSILSIGSGREVRPHENTLRIGGNWLNQVGEEAFAEGSASVEFFGSAQQNIETNNGEVFYNATFNNSSANGVFLDSDVLVNNNFTMELGRITLQNNNLTFRNLFGNDYSASKMVVADNQGQLRKLIVGNGPAFFPVGDNTGTPEYSPAEIELNSGNYAVGAYLGVNLENAVQSENNSPDHRLNRFWTLYPNGITNPNYEVRFRFLPADVIGDINQLWGGLRDISNTRWVCLGPVDVPSTSIFATGLTNFELGVFTGGEFGPNTSQVFHNP
jgi:hypothetical protein